MRVIVVALLVVLLAQTLTGCYTLAVGAAGAGGGYIYKQKEQEGKVP